MKAKYESLGKNIRRYRRVADLTQEKLADRIGYTPSHVGAVENASGVPSFEMLIKIADTLNVSMDQLCYGSIENVSGYLMDEFNRYTEGFDDKQRRCAVDMAVAVWKRYKEYTG